MTNDEAIAILQSMIPTPCRADGKSTTHTLETIALTMAIKALESKDVFDRIKAEIIAEFGNCDICEWFEDYDYEENNISEYRFVGDISDIIEIINKYKAESEEV